MAIGTDSLKIWEKKQEDEKVLDEKVRNIMNNRSITYQEAAGIVKAGQKSIFEF